MALPLTLTLTLTLLTPTTVQWLETHDTSPSTGAKLESSFLIPNVTVRSLIREFLEANPQLAEQGHGRRGGKGGRGAQGGRGGRGGRG